ncbi:MAG TPA: hemolysin family protein [Acidimicrobiia bacterium]|nr:hemolysin family protein [Acidimicrobiia bacterium]
MVLIALNGFFVAGEFALVAVNRSRVDSQAAEGDRKAQRVAARLRDLSFELSGAQLGITITSLVLGAVAEPTVARLISPVLEGIGIESERVSITTALILATGFQMVLGELFPKNVAIARPYAASLRVGLPMGTVNRFLRPLIQFFNRSANWTVRRFGIEPRDELVGLRSLQELEMIVRASSAEGELGVQETSLLTRAIAFVDKDAAEVMVPRVSVNGLPADASVNDLRRLAVETGHSRFPVYQGDLDTVIGIALVKDTFSVPVDQRDRVPVSTLASAPQVVPESMHLDTLLIELQRAGRTMAVVVDEYGGTAGIVTVEDIVEEILGEIQDEHDAALQPAERQPGTLSGSLHRHEVEDLSGFAWPEGGYETLNGFVTAELDRFPRPGDVIRAGAFRIEVLDVEDHIATRLHITEEGRK